MLSEISLLTGPQNRPSSPLSWISIDCSDLRLVSWDFSVLWQNCVKLFMMFGLSSVGIYDIKNLAFPAHRSNPPAHRSRKNCEVILAAGIDMARGCLMDKQKYRPGFYQLNQEGFIRWAKSQDNIVNRDIWRKTGRERRKMVRIGCETSGLKTWTIGVSLKQS